MIASNQISLATAAALALWISNILRLPSASRSRGRLICIQCVCAVFGHAGQFKQLFIVRHSLNNVTHYQQPHDGAILYVYCSTSSCSSSGESSKDQLSADLSAQAHISLVITQRMCYFIALLHAYCNGFAYSSEEWIKSLLAPLPLILFQLWQQRNE